MNPEALQARGFCHEALFYSGDDEFLAGAVPFLEEGIGDGETVLVVLSEQRMRLVRKALGSTAGAVEFWPMAEVGRNPARLIPAWRDFLRTCDPGHGVRGLGEPISSKRSAAEVEECELHERLFNLAFAKERTLTVLCPYDTDALGGEALRGAERSHPVCAYSHGRAVSSRYSLDAPLAGELSQPGRPSVTFEFGKSDLAMVRHLVSQCGRFAGIETRRNEDLVLAVCEVATNSIQHGGGKGRLFIWDDEDELICAIHDSGTIRDPLVGRERPRPELEHGRGLWLANQLCDLVQIRSGEAGTDIRLRMRFER